MTHRETVSTFDAWAKNGKDAGMEDGHGDVARQVFARLEVGTSDRILDLGCGNGWATRALAKLASGTSAIGVDASPEMIKRAEALHSFTIRARYECMGFEALEFKDAHFDRAFSMEALYYASDLDAALTELRRVLKPGAPFDVVVHCYREHELSQRWSELLGVPMHCLSEAQWQERLGAVGFESVAAERVVDTRGPGERATFEASRWVPTWEDAVASHASGYLWLRGRAPR